MLAYSLMIIDKRETGCWVSYTDSYQQRENSLCAVKSSALNPVPSLSFCYFQQKMLFAVLNDSMLTLTCDFVLVFHVARNFPKNFGGKNKNAK